MNEREFDIRDGKVIDKAGALLNLGRMKSKFPLTPPAAFVDHYAYCKTCFHFDACCGMDAEDHMYDLTECENHISVMTPEQFKEEMQKLSEDDDVELRHEATDGLLLKVLRSFGYSEGVDIFVNTKMWYA